MTAPDPRDSVELLPCPFCGDTPSRADIRADANQGDKWGRVDCGCGASGPEVRTGYEPVEVWAGRAIEEWNRRALPQQAGGEDVERVRELLIAGGMVASAAWEAVKPIREGIAALQAEVARRTDSVIVVGATALACSSAVKEMFDLMHQRAEAAEAALREVEKDAARYRWLRDSSLGQREHPIVVSQRRAPFGTMQYVGPMIGVELDAAIDAAIGGTGDA